MISMNDLGMRYGSNILFKNVTLQLNPGRHYGLIGANGSGKSTFLKILTGELTQEKGDVMVPSQINVGTLKQDHYLYEDVLILDAVLQGNQKLWKALQAKQELLQSGSFSEKDCHALEAIDKLIDEEKGYAAPSQAAKILEGLGLPERLHSHPMRVLSGGYKLRVLLAQVLFSKPEVLLLDEPTNHLDIFSIHWLEGYLSTFPGTIVVSSHDRHFLNAVCTDIMDVDHETIKIYKGNFDLYEVKKQEDRELNEAILSKQEKKRDHMQVFIDRFQAKATKARQAQSKMRFVEKLEEEMADLDLSPSSRCYPKIRFEVHRPSGVISLTVHDIHKAYGEKHVLKHVSFEVARGDHIAFIGPNGIGKSTLLEILTQSIQADSGEFKWGHAAQFAYFPQDHAREMKSGGTLLEWLRTHDQESKEEYLREVLARVLFVGDDVHKSVHVLSGGETARLILAKMMVLKHNVLIFDEPTNHLDMEATEVLVNALKNYTGTVLLVSHNRHFVTHTATRVIEMTEKGLRDFKCSYEEYLAKEEQDHLSAIKSKADAKDDKIQAKTQYEDQKQQKRLKAQLEKKVAANEARCHELEQAIAKIDVQLASEGFYQNNSQDVVKRLLADKSGLEAKLSEAFDQWEESHRELPAS